MQRVYAGYIATALMLYVAGVDVEDMGPLGPLTKQLGVAIILLLGAHFLFRKRTWKSGNLDSRVSIVFSLFFIYGILSLYWTFDAPATTVVIVAWLYIASLCVIFSGLSQKACFRLILDVTFVFCLAGFIRVFIGSEAFVLNQGVDRLQGIFFGPHALAQPCALALVILASGVDFKHRVIKIVYLLVIGLSLYLTFSRQAYLAALVGCFMTLLLRAGSVARTRSIIFLMFATIVCGLILELNGGVSMDAFSRGEGDDVTTLTGRTEIWKASMELISEKPYLGYGFGAGGSALENYYAAGVAEWRTFNTHNGFLQAQLDLGVVGMTLYGILFFYFLRSTVLSGDFSKIGLATSMLLITMVERGAYGTGGLVVMFFVFFAFRQNRDRTNIY